MTPYHLLILNQKMCNLVSRYKLLGKCTPPFQGANQRHPKGLLRRVHWSHAGIAKPPSLPSSSLWVLAVYLTKDWVGEPGPSPGSPISQPWPERRRQGPVPYPKRSDYCAGQRTTGSGSGGSPSKGHPSF